MKFPVWLISGLIGAFVGAIAWAALAYFAHIELGWLAWGIGVLAGLGVRATAGDANGPGPGAAAVVAAVLAIAAAKCGTIALYLNVSRPITEADAKVVLADVVVRERTRNGIRIVWPKGVTAQTASEEKDYPKDVWSQAEQRWAALTAAEQSRHLSDRQHLWFLDDELRISYIAEGIMDERAKAPAGAPARPATADPDDSRYREDYPEDVWTEANERWAKLTPDERHIQEDSWAAMVPQQAFSPDLMWRLFVGTLSPFDALWLALAVLSAWRLGSGKVESVAQA